MHLSVDQADASWTHGVGLVTEGLRACELDPSGIAFVCGPTPMMRAVVALLRDKGLEDANIYVSLERLDAAGNVVGPVLPLTDPRVGL